MPLAAMSLPDGTGMLTKPIGTNATTTTAMVMVVVVVVVVKAVVVTMRTIIMRIMRITRMVVP